MRIAAYCKWDGRVSTPKARIQPLNLAHTEGGFWKMWLHHLCGSLPVLLLLCLATALLHAVHLFDGVDGWFMRKTVESVVLGQHQAEGMELELPSPEKRIVVLEASTLMRVTELEHDGLGLDQATLDRIGGVRPIDREKMAGFLSRLASRFDRMKEVRQPLPAVVAIDVDMTPLLQPQPLQVSQAVIDALTRLRKHVHVVAIVLDRQTKEGRVARNTFMAKDACCTREESPIECTPKEPQKGLFFASPRVFHATHGYPLHFPLESKKCDESDYPALGNLIHALTVGPKPTQRSLKALTRLCEEAARPSPHGLIEEDRVAGRECLSGHETECPGTIKETHRLHRINWKLAGFGPIDSHVLAPVGSANAAPGTVKLHEIDFTALDVGALILGIDGGSRHDRFEGASVMTEAISGARLHALLAASRHKPAKEDDSVAFLVDVLVGLVFLALWVSIKPGVDMLAARSSNTSLAALTKATVLAGLSVAVGWMYVEWWSPRLLQHFDIWANPAYLLAGLALGAYVDVSSADGHEPQTGWPDFSFGIARVWNSNPGWDDITVSALALLVCGAGIITLFAMDTGWQAALVSSALIGVSCWKNWRTAG